MFTCTGETVDIGRQFEILGHPISSVKWYRDGKLLRADSRVLMGRDSRGHRTKLKIKSVTKKDAGEYEVRVMGGE